MLTVTSADISYG